MRATTRITTHGSEVELAEADTDGECLPFDTGVDDHRVVRGLSELLPVRIPPHPITGGNRIRQKGAAAGRNRWSG
jgi:hypothetical protein